MAVVYDNWERLVTATLRREQLRLSALRTPSDVSSASLSSSSSFDFTSPATRVWSFNNSSSLPVVGKSFTYDQILVATDYFSKSNFIKHGRSGDLFYGVLEGGLQVVVKRVNMSGSSYLINELEILGKISHARFVPFLGYCFENGNTTFLVYKYMFNKDLSSCLTYKGISSDDTKVDCQKSTSLSWVTRLKIATGAAQGLCYLHHECVPPLVHRKFEARSILIDENFEARIGRLTEVCTEKKEKNQNGISRLLRLSRASEGGITGSLNARCAYDVYCFGKVLLELVTGYPGFDDLKDSSINAGIENILPYISTYDKELFVKIVDPSLEVDLDQLIELWALAIIAKACLSPKPSKRPEMRYILEALEDPKSVISTVAKTKATEGMTGVGISKASANATFSDTATSGSPNSAATEIQETCPIWDIGDPNNLRVYTLQELVAATENFKRDRVLGEGGFGRVYKGQIHDKSISKGSSQSVIAIKKLNPESFQGFQEWQTEIYMLGTLSHPNLIKLLGYCQKDYNLLLVYEFMPRGSFDNHLFGRGSSIQPLQWEVRLKILIGAARALAFLHALKKQVIYRNFKASNILLDRSYNAKLSDFGFARVGPSDSQSHVTTRVMGTSGYAAPEYVATGHLYVKSDVYGFGVVLAEVLTGLRAVDLNRPQGQRNLVDWIRPCLYGRSKIKNIMDPRLEGKYPMKAAVEMVQLALRCLDSEPKARPSMEEVVDVLERIASANDKQKRT